MNLKASLKTGVRDAVRGTLIIRPDIYLFMALAFGFIFLTMAFTTYQHGDLTDAETVEMMRGLGYGVMFIALFPAICGIFAAAARAVGRRTRWASSFRWPNEKYITVEEHEAAMRSLRDDVEAAALEELRRELESPDGGHE